MKATSPRAQCTVAAEQARIGSYELRFWYQLPQMWHWFQSSILECKKAFTNKRGVFWDLKRKKTLCRAEGVPATESECDGQCNFREISLKPEIKKKKCIRNTNNLQIIHSQGFPECGCHFWPQLYLYLSSKYRIRDIFSF